MRPYLGRNPLDIAKVPIKDTFLLEKQNKEIDRRFAFLFQPLAK